MAKKVVIDAGHGGKDGGASGNGIVEKDYTLKISNYIHNRLDELGIENSMTRTTDELLDQSTRPKRAQSFYGNGSDVILLSNHLNAGGGNGAELIYSLRNTDALSKKIGYELENAGQNIRKYYQKRLPSNPTKDYYYLLRNTPNNETLIVEYGFLDNESDATFIKNNWEKLAEAVVKALASYVGVSYKAPSGNATKPNEYYIVQKGDSLWSIAKKYNTTVDKLKETNNLKSNLLQIGQQLKLPTSSSTNDEYYIVKKGDNLYNLAKEYNTTVDQIVKLNNLSTTVLQIGQKLKIPTTMKTYTVKSGDTLYKIANENKTTVDKLKSVNNLSSNLLQIGQKLIIPN